MKPKFHLNVLFYNHLFLLKGDKMLANSLVLMGLGIVIIIVGFPSNKKERLRSIKEIYN